jgi:hypothetical protein
VVYPVIARIIEVQCPIAFLEMREIFADEKEFLLRKYLFIEECLESLFTDGLFFFGESYVFDAEVVEDLFGDIQFLDVLECEDAILVACELFHKFLDVDIADIISLLIFSSEILFISFQ